MCVCACVLPRACAFKIMHRHRRYVAGGVLHLLDFKASVLRSMSMSMSMSMSVSMHIAVCATHPQNLNPQP